MEYLPSYKDDLYLAHHGIKGQKWGVRRFQNSDGSYTSAGKNRYGGKSVTQAIRTTGSNWSKSIKQKWNNRAEQEWRERMAKQNNSLGYHYIH